ncbi:MAG TPA: PadR family transcriptional regulator [Chloroflexota bacterium]|nr:PadR family transcriptional regulator [Chloroflexota bacterium]
MYELFILGLLLERPMHGYLLHQIISVAIGPTRQMSWGALYPLIRRLEEEDLIEHDETASTAHSGHQRKIFRITELGRQRFYWLMLAPGEYNVEYPDLFTIKLCHIRYVGPKDQLTLLRHHEGYLRFVRDYLQVNRQRVLAHPGIPDEQRPYILRAIDHRLRLNECDEQWLEGELAQVRARLEDPQEQHGTANTVY